LSHREESRNSKIINGTAEALIFNLNDELDSKSSGASGVLDKINVSLSPYNLMSISSCLTRSYFATGLKLRVGTIDELGELD
jgi:hypothetical protein